MKSSRAARIQSTLGEVITVLYEETQDLFELKTDERQLVVAYILNDLTRRPLSVKRSRRSKRK